ncbi:conserved protein, unknown function [Hepatocystis sp. ex Piliocolobus tephrosceles]|nr:conserved protein, unknown function [Hepatocystis sp. ex Piliocolobus tephrosceles]
MKGTYINKHLFRNIPNTKHYKNISTNALKNINNGTTTIPLYHNNNILNPLYTNLINKNKFSTYKTKTFTPDMYNNTSPNYVNSIYKDINSNNNINNNSNYMYGQNYNSNALNSNYSNNYYGNNNNVNRSNLNSSYSNNMYNNYDPNFRYEMNNNINIPTKNFNNMNEGTDMNTNYTPTAPTTTYQYYSLFGSTCMCLFKPIFPDQFINKNKITIFGKGGFQFIFMKKIINSNKYDKNNKMSIFCKINTLYNLLLINSIEDITSPIIIKGTNNNYIIFDKHAEKKDSVVIKYKYNPTTVTTTNSNNNLEQNIDNNSNDISNNLFSDIQKNENNIENLEDKKKNNFELLHVSFTFSEFLIFQRAANMLLPQLLGWAKQ